jgi:hypothetical protein
MPSSALTDVGAKPLPFTPHCLPFPEEQRAPLPLCTDRSQNNEAFLHLTHSFEFNAPIGPGHDAFSEKSPGGLITRENVIVKHTSDCPLHCRSREMDGIPLHLESFFVIALRNATHTELRKTRRSAGKSCFPFDDSFLTWALFCTFCEICTVWQSASSRSRPLLRSVRFRISVSSKSHRVYLRRPPFPEPLHKSPR